MDPRIAARRRRVQESRARRNIRRLLVLIVVAAAVGGVYWLLRSPLLDVDEVVVDGADRAPVVELLADAGVVAGTPLIDVDVDEVTDRLLADPWIETVAVTRSWSGTVSVSIVERVPVAWVRGSSGGAVAAADGTILERPSDPPNGLPMVEALGLDLDQTATDAVVTDTLRLLDALAPQVLTVTSLAVVDGQVEGRIGHYVVRIGRPGPPAEKAAALMAVIDSAPAPGSIITVLSADRPSVRPPTADGQPDQPGESTTTSP